MTERRREAKKILVVDDLATDLHEITQILEKAGYDVCAALNGAEAIDFCEKQPFDLAIIDIMMPIFSGDDLITVLRERGLDIPIIIVTILPASQVRTKDVELTLSKPVSAQILLESVQRILQGSSAKEESQEDH